MTQLDSDADGGAAQVSMQWGIRIPLRDGIHLHALLYLPADGSESTQLAITTLTPYVAQSWHDVAVYFAARGNAFLAVDVRGRGNSEGVFRPGVHESDDAYDVIEWLAEQSYCNGKVAMWGGSYGGHLQWAASKSSPPHLATIVPVASPYFGVDFPLRGNIFTPYLIQWLTLISGRTSQERIFADGSFWTSRFREYVESGIPYRRLDALVGNTSEIFQEWVAHPQRDAYWDAYNPDRQQYARLAIPVLTITGIYDGDQLGALTHYREHLKAAALSGTRALHCLIIGPWDHAGTRAPKQQFGGIDAGAASLVDLRHLHLQWYAWATDAGPRPEFLEKDVAYYVFGAQKWRYARTLEDVTARVQALYLHSSGAADGVFRSGSLAEQQSPGGGPDNYIYDPRDVTLAPIESAIDTTGWITDQSMVYASEGKQVIYHSAVFLEGMEISGFFKLTAWLAIDQPDTDFRVSVYEIDASGNSILLSAAWLRARYRESLREQQLVTTTAPVRYDFEDFSFVSRRVERGSRLRLVIGPHNSIYFQKNYNSGGVVSKESIADARAVSVRLFHDESHPSALYVPVGHPEQSTGARASISHSGGE